MLPVKIPERHESLHIIKLYPENQCHEGIEWPFHRMMKCYLCLHMKCLASNAREINKKIGIKIKESRCFTVKLIERIQKWIKVLCRPTYW